MDKKSAIRVLVFLSLGLLLLFPAGCSQPAQVEDTTKSFTVQVQIPGETIKTLDPSLELMYYFS